MSEPCANCHKLEHTIEKQETQLEELSGELTDAAAALRQPQPNPGHQGFQELLDCPNCGAEALKSFEDAGGAVLSPADFQPKLVELVKSQFPMFSKGVEIST